MENNIILMTVNEVMEHYSDAHRDPVSHTWTVKFPYRHKFSDKELAYLKRYGLEDFLNWQYSLYEETVWTKVRKKVRSLLPKDIIIDDWELHDDYIYPSVIIEEPPQKMTDIYFRRFKKMKLL